MVGVDSQETRCPHLTPGIMVQTSRDSNNVAQICMIYTRMPSHLFVNANDAGMPGAGIAKVELRDDTPTVAQALQRPGLLVGSRQSYALRRRARPVRLHDRHVVTGWPGPDRVERLLSVIHFRSSRYEFSLSLSLSRTFYYSDVIPSPPERLQHRRPPHSPLPRRPLERGRGYIYWQPHRRRLRLRPRRPPLPRHRRQIPRDLLDKQQSHIRPTRDIRRQRCLVNSSSTELSPTAADYLFHGSVYRTSGSNLRSL